MSRYRSPCTRTWQVDPCRRGRERGGGCTVQPLSRAVQPVQTGMSTVHGTAGPMGRRDAGNGAAPLPAIAIVANRSLPIRKSVMASTDPQRKNVRVHVAQHALLQKLELAPDRHGFQTGNFNGTRSREKRGGCTVQPPFSTKTRIIGKRHPRRHRVAHEAIRSRWLSAPTPTHAIDGHTIGAQPTGSRQAPLCNCLAQALRTDASMCWTNMS